MASWALRLQPSRPVRLLTLLVICLVEELPVKLPTHRELIKPPKWWTMSKRVNVLQAPLQMQLDLMNHAELQDLVTDLVPHYLERIKWLFNNHEKCLSKYEGFKNYPKERWIYIRTSWYANTLRRAEWEAAVLKETHPPWERGRSRY